MTSGIPSHVRGNDDAPEPGTRRPGLPEPRGVARIAAVGDTAESEREGTRRPRPSEATVSVVVPARNEARNVAWVLEQMPEWIDEVLLVDGDSNDATLAMARHCLPSVRVVPQRGPGKGNALRTGFEAATGDYIVTIDADGSMSPSEIPHYIHYLDNGYDFVKGSRFMGGGGSQDITTVRKAGNQALLMLVNRLYDANLTDLCYGFVAFRRLFLEHLDLRSTGFEIETEMTVRALRAGLRITEVPSIEMPRRYGVSNLHAVRDGLRVLNTVMNDRRSPRPATPPKAAAPGRVRGGHPGHAGHEDDTALPGPRREGEARTR